METLDFGPATSTLARLVAAVRDDQLDDPTPCRGTSVAGLLDHIQGLPIAFAAAARKQRLDPGSAAPRADASALGDGWRERIGDRLADLAEAWRDPAAYDGTTQAGPVEMPAREAALVALDEVVVHGWDLAVATGQVYEPHEPSVVACRRFVESFDAPVDDGSLFGPPVPVPADAPELDLLLGATGRRPDWSPPAG